MPWRVCYIQRTKRLNVPTVGKLNRWLGKVPYLIGACLLYYRDVRSR